MWLCEIVGATVPRLGRTEGSASLDSRLNVQLFPVFPEDI